MRVRLDISRRGFAIAFVGAALVVLLAWQKTFLLLGFAAVLVALCIDGLARPLLRLVPRPVALAVVVALLPLCTAGVALLVGPTLVEQVGQLKKTLPKAASALRGKISTQPGGKQLLARVSGALKPDKGSGLSKWLLGIFSNTVSGLASTLTALVIGIYLAFSPGTYIRGLLYLLPPGHKRQRGRQVLGGVGHALRRWLLGQLGAMAVVGLLTGIALLIAGIPAALPLALIAGAMTFVPVVGPALSAVPALLIGFAKSLLSGGIVLAIYGGVQLLEGNVITPLIQKRGVSMPPVLQLAAQALAALIYGLPGLLLAAPLAVAATVLVQALYVQDVLGDRVSLLGEPRADDGDEDSGAAARDEACGPPEPQAAAGPPEPQEG